MDDASRIEDLEEALRRIVTVISPDLRHVQCERGQAVLAIALEQLGLDLLLSPDQVELLFH